MNTFSRRCHGFAAVAAALLLSACDLADIFGRQEVQESLKHVTFKYHVRASLSDAELAVINQALDTDPGRITDVSVTGTLDPLVCEVTDRSTLNLDMNGDAAELTDPAENENTLELSALTLQDDSAAPCPLDAADDLVFSSGQNIHIDTPMPVATLELKYGDDLFTAVGQHARVILDGYNNNRFATGTFQFLARRQCAGLSGAERDSCNNDPRALIVFNGVFADVD